MSKMSTMLAVLGVVAGLGVAALPLSTYAATDSDDATVKLTLEDYIACEVTTEDKTVEITGVVNNGEVKTADATVNVKTNNENGYTLAIKAKTSTDLVNADDAEAKIPAGTPGQGTSAWGFKGGDLSSSWNTIATTDTVILENGTKPTDNDGTDTTVTFGASADASQKAGTYTGVVTFTATTKLGA